MADDYEKESPKEDASDKDILEDCRKYLKICVDEEKDERAKMADDVRFCTLDQWPEEIRHEREDPNQEGGARPCLTIDKINQYIVQVVNDMRQGKPGINIRPMDDSADVETAKVLKGIIRNIEDQSKADIAYAAAGESQCKIGMGFIRVMTEYVSEDSFDQEIFIRPVNNPFSVYLEKHTMPDGSDAKRGWVVDQIPVDRFKEEFPGKKWKSGDFDGLDVETKSYWRTDELVTVVEYFYIERTRQTLIFLADGTTITEADYAKWPKEAGAKPSEQNRRTTFKEQLKWCKATGIEVLEKRDLPGKYIPIIEVVGRESYVKGKRILWGLVRPAKDSLRMYNYFASAITEKMGLAPKAPWIMAEGQDEGHEAMWRDSNRKPFSRLIYKAIDVNGNAIPAPQRVGPPAMEAALLQQMQVIEHDVQTSLGMFKAATGESESQQSGRAILALQRESDTGTYHFGANQGVSIRHVGIVVLDMIPHYYDTKRIVRILGDDGEVKTAQIDPEQEQAHRQIQQANGAIQSIYNPGVGKYDVAITVGPSYNTKRMEDQAIFVEMAKGASDPASAAVMRYFVMRNSDSPGAQEAAKVFKSLLPPPALQALATNAPIPPQAQAMLAQMHAKMQQMMEEGQKLQEENLQLKAGAQVKMAELQVKEAAASEDRKLELAKAHDGHQLAIETSTAEVNLAVWKARLEAATKIEVAQIAAKTSLAETAVQAETAANTELITAMMQPPGEASSKDSIAPQRPIEKLADLHKQGMDMHAKSMDKLTAILGELSKPKTVTAISSSGAKLTAKVG